MEEGRVPCLWILGAMDNYIPCDIIQTRVKLPPNARVVILKNPGIWDSLKKKSKSVKVITEFVKKFDLIGTNRRLYNTLLTFSENR